MTSTPSLHHTDYLHEIRGTVEIAGLTPCAPPSLVHSAFGTLMLGVASMARLLGRSHRMHSEEVVCIAVKAEKR
jgi:hypothetical protein